MKFVALGLALASPGATAQAAGDPAHRHGLVLSTCYPAGSDAYRDVVFAAEVK